MKHHTAPFTRAAEVLRAAFVLAVILFPILAAFVLLRPVSVDPSEPPDIEEAVRKEERDTEAAESDKAENGLPAVSTRREGVLNFLIAGKDRASGLLDVIVLAQLDTKRGTASIVQIPRDTYAEYTERDYKKLNGAASALGGLDGLCGFLSASLGIPIDHYALVDLDCVGDIVDAIGGVPIDIPTDMDYEDTAQGLSIHLKAGRQILNGDTAEAFLRFRSGYITADLGRLDAQKLFISAFLTAVKENTSLQTLVRIVRTLYGRVETDLSIGSTLKLAVSALKLRPEALTMATLPGKAVRTEETAGAWYYVIHRQAAYDTVNRMLNVYDTPIAQEAFDPLERFTSTAYPHFDAVYREKSTENEAFSGTEIDRRYRSLPRVKD
jgi:LCP family protein required for cell wall assembly